MVQEFEQAYTGSKVAPGRWRVVSVEDGRTLTSWHQGAVPSYSVFSTDGRTVWSGGLDGVLSEWDADTGLLVREFTGIGTGRPSTAPDRVLVTRSYTAGAVVVGAGPRGEGWSVPRCPRPGADLSPADQVRVTGDLVLTNRQCRESPGALDIFSLGGRAGTSVAGAVSGQALEVSPDGTRVVAGAAGPEGSVRVGRVQVRDVRTGEVLVTLHPPLEGPFNTFVCAGPPTAAGSRECPSSSDSR